MTNSSDVNFIEAARHYRAGDYDKAEHYFRQYLLSYPDDVPGWVNLGVVSRLNGHPLQALSCYRVALVVDPGRFEALSNLAVVTQQIGETNLATRLLGRAKRLKPTLSFTYSRLGAAFQELGNHSAALASLDRAIALSPSNIEAYLHRGNLFQAGGKLGDSMASYHRALSLDRNNLKVLNNLGGVLQLAGEWPSALECMNAIMAKDPLDLKVHSNILMGFNYDHAMDDDELFKEHCAFGRKLAEIHGNPANIHENTPSPHRRLRIGYVSADFGRHPTGYFLLPVFAAHDPQAVEVYCYSGRVEEDELTSRLRSCATVWRRVVGIDDVPLAELIRKDCIDVLVDLSGHTAGNRLVTFHFAPAPVQVSWLGYFNTTGVPAIQAVLMDSVTVPPGNERWFTEEVVRLPDTRFCYSPPEYAPAVSAPPLLRNKYPTFGSFNNLAKITPPTIRLWVDLLLQVPDARLILKWRTLADQEVRSKIHKSFAEGGVDPSRIDLRPASPHAVMLGEYADIDIALDPSPFGGGLTSYEALWMGVPVVTLPVERPSSRQTAALLKMLGLDDLVCDTEGEFLKKAVALCADGHRLMSLRTDLRARMLTSPVCDGEAFVRHLERVYRVLWGRWCSGQL